MFFIKLWSIKSIERCDDAEAANKSVKVFKRKGRKETEECGGNVLLSSDNESEEEEERLEHDFFFFFSLDLFYLPSLRK